MNAAKKLDSRRFYDFLNDLKVNSFSGNNISLVEAIEQGASVLFESATIAQSLKGRAIKNPFFGHEMKFIKQLALEKMGHKEFNYPETGDRRIPYEHFNEKFVDTFINWVAWNVMEQTNEDEDDLIQQIEEIKEKISTLDPNQLDLFGYKPEERGVLFMNEVKKASLLYLDQHKDRYNQLVDDILYNTPNKEISNPEQDSRHNGDMAGWGEEEYEAYSEFKYSSAYYVADEALEAWIHYLYKSASNPEIFKRFKDPNYDISMAMHDADQLNEDNHEKVIQMVNKEIGREKYESAEVVIEMGNFSWVNSTKQSCSAEGKEMGHCGNEHGPDVEPADELWSLREGGSPREWKSHLTVIINGEDIVPGKRIIKQFVGNGPKTGNARPSEKYHQYILELLTSKDGDRWIVDGFFLDDYYARNVSFKISDLSEENQKKLHSVRPELFEQIERTA